MMRALFIVTLAALTAGCNKGSGTILVTVTADPAITSVAKLDIHASSGTRASDFSATLPMPGPLPPEQTFAITAPASLGTLHVEVRARDENDVEVGAGATDAAISGGKRSDVTVTLGAPGSLGDGGTDDGGLDGGGGDGGGTPSLPRLVAPISGSTATSKRPTLRWELPAGITNVAVDVCATRDCATTLQPVAVDGSGTSGAPMMDLPRGVVFWRVRGTSAGQAVASATWELSIPGKTAARDTAQGPYHDFNGDGQADVIVGAPNATNTAGTAQAGRAYLELFFGGTPFLMESNDVTKSQYGTAVASAGDTDGDGLCEALVGAFYATNTNGDVKAGRAYLYKWDAANNKPTLVHLFDGADGANTYFGQNLGPAGDVNGDGYADFAISSSANGGDGRVYVYMGSATGPNYATPTILDGPAGGREFFGSQVITAGDVNGDGYADLVVGAYIATVAGASGTGRLYLFLGGPTGLSKQPAQVIDGMDGANTFFTQSVAPLGDVNGDGYADVAAGDNGATVNSVTNVGRIYIFHGGPDGKLHLAKTLDGLDGQNDGWGGQNSVHGWVDFNADGYHDLVVSSYPSAGAAKMYVYLGGPNGITTPLATPLSSADSGWGSQATPGDFNMDGYGDLVGGANGVNNVGRIYLYPGGANGPSGTASSTYDGTDAAGGFGGYLGRRGPVRRRR